jgi:hypothetical protein
MSDSALNFVFPLPFFVICASVPVMGYREGAIAEVVVTKGLLI